MSRILINKNKPFEQSYTKINWHYELDFEEALLSNSDLIFENYFVTKFKHTLYPDFVDMYSVEADLLLVSKDYSHWLICEVELSHHSMKDHIIPQIMKIYHSSVSPSFFENSKLSNTVIKMMTDRYGSLVEKDSILELIKNNRPGTLVIFDDLSGIELKKYSDLEMLRSWSSIAEIKVYSDEEENYGYLVSGLEKLLPSHCNAKCNTSLNLILDRPSIFNFSKNELVEITIKSHKNSNYESYKLTCQVHPSKLRVLMLKDEVVENIKKGIYRISEIKGELRIEDA